MDKKVLTQDGFKKLEEELEYLKNEKRPQVAERIKQAKEFGDLSENAEYQEAKEEQAFTEGRILELEHLIKTSIVAENTSNNDAVNVGNVVTVEKDGHNSDFTVVGSTEADPINGKISLESPIGGALLNKKVGDIVEVDLPGGKANYKIIAIK